MEEAPMWGNIQPKEHDLYAEKCADLMRESDSFEFACLNVLDEWPMSCMHNLSARCMNRMAWLGHAACYLQTGSVEYTTRMGWRLLSKDEQNEANRVAMKVINFWEGEQCQK